MQITHLKSLLNDPTSQKITYLSACLENEDKVFIASNFNRSSYHSLKFLIIYAALNSNNRRLSIIKLNAIAANHLNQSFTQQELDELIEKMDWTAILARANNPSHITFDLNIQVKSPAYFLNDAKNNCLTLYNALTHSSESIVKIFSSSNKNSVSFTTIIQQDEKWIKPFKQNLDELFKMQDLEYNPERLSPEEKSLKPFYFDVKERWETTTLKLSPQFLSIIEKMNIGQTETIAGFKVIKGDRRDSYNLSFPAPPSLIGARKEWYDSGKYLLQEQLNPTPQIYNSFLGLTKVFGLARIETVIVTTYNHGELSIDGLTVKQVDKVEFMMMSGWKDPSLPTQIIASGVNMMLPDSGISVQFQPNSTEIEFNEQIYVELATKSGANVRFTNAKPNPLQNWAIMHPGSKPLHLEKKPDASSTRSPMFFSNQDQDSTTAQEITPSRKCCIIS